MKVVAVVQARMGSSRLPGKSMMPIKGYPMIELQLKRLSRCEKVDLIVVAASDSPNDQCLVDHVKSLGFECERGSEGDVLTRYIDVLKKHSGDVIVRITGDCPLVDPALVDLLIAQFLGEDADYLSNVDPHTYPDGLDIEVFKYPALERAHLESVTLYDREHVTTYIRKSDNFRKVSFKNPIDLSHLRWTVDYPEDLAVVSKVFDYFWPDIFFRWEDVLKLQLDNPEIFELNEKRRIKELKWDNSGYRLWQRAKQVIPGGNMLLSKRPEMFLPDLWPTYFSRARGCKVWDLDDNVFVDMSLMGVGTNTLGYSHPLVDGAVHEAVRSGNMSTLNCPEEVRLAETLIEIHPWAQMVKFARTGGEANAIAIRIARASSGRSKVAFCGYHGWHDWYLSANLAESNSLDGHLLQGLEPLGVPRELAGTVFPFSYNNFSELEDLVNRNDIGVIKMEVARNKEPEPGFLEQVRKLSTARGIVLIFDECTSGFRQNFGGLHMHYGVEPDIATFGKALGNGYAITAIVGRREVMEAAQSTFISSTFWTEKIGPTAALSALKVMKQEESWRVITEVGQTIRAGWQRLAESHRLSIDHWGLPALAGFAFRGRNASAYKTLISQQMLEKRFLAGANVYACIAHTNEIINSYFDALDPVFRLIKECEDGRPVSELLKTKVCHTGFSRLN